MRSAELFAEVLKQPGDDARVKVWADSLLAEGDPRGELIVLQLAQEKGELDDVGKLRIEVLTEKHWSAWLPGQVRRLAERAVFRRGLPVEVWINQTLEPFLVPADWAGVECVGLLDGDRIALEQPALLDQLVRLPLKGLKGVTRPVLQYVGRQLEELGLHAGAVDSDVLELLRARLPLKRLHVQGVKDPVVGHRVCSSPLAQGLERLSIDFNTFEVSWWPAQSKVRLHVFVEDPPMLRIEAELRAGPKAHVLEVQPPSQRPLFLPLAAQLLPPAAG
jgi:hypothetical protein